MLLFTQMMNVDWYSDDKV